MSIRQKNKQRRAKQVSKSSMLIGHHGITRWGHVAATIRHADLESLFRSLLLVFGPVEMGRKESHSNLSKHPTRFLESLSKLEDIQQWPKLLMCSSVAARPLGIKQRCPVSMKAVHVTMVGNNILVPNGSCAYALKNYVSIESPYGYICRHGPALISYVYLVPLGLYDQFTLHPSVVSVCFDVHVHMFIYSCEHVHITKEWLCQPSCARVHSTNMVLMPAESKCQPKCSCSALKSTAIMS